MGKGIKGHKPLNKTGQQGGSVVENRETAII